MQHSSIDNSRQVAMTSMVLDAPIIRCRKNLLWREVLLNASISWCRELLISTINADMRHVRGGGFCLDLPRANACTMMRLNLIPQERIFRPWSATGDQCLLLDRNNTSFPSEALPLAVVRPWPTTNKIIIERCNWLSSIQTYSVTI